MRHFIFLAKRSLCFFTALTLMVGLAQADELAEVTLLLRAGKLAEAQSRADQYLQLQPRDVQMRFLKGVIQRDSGQTDQAIASFSQLVEDFPELPEPYNNLAVLFAGKGEYEKARGMLEMAIRNNPSYATAYENLGDVYARLSSQAYNRALQLDKANPALAPKLERSNAVLAAQEPKQPEPAAAIPAAVPQPSVTPLATTAPTPTPSTTAQLSTALGPDSAATQEVAAAVTQWARHWSAKDVRAYLASYSPDFVPAGSVGRKAWEDERSARITSKRSIQVQIDALQISVNGKRAAARFRQNYKSDSLELSNNKVLDMAKVGERWLIVNETVTP